MKKQFVGLVMLYKILPSYAQEQDLYLDIILNQSTQTQIGHFIETQDHRLLIDRATLNDLKIKTTAQDDPEHTQFLDLKSIQGLTFYYDVSQQQIKMQATADVLNSNAQIELNNQSAPAQMNPDQIKPGVLLNYDLYQQYNKDNTSLNVWNEIRLFGLNQGGFLSVSGNYSYTKDRQQSSTSAQVLDTYWQQDFVNNAISVVIGDSQSQALTWSRSTRISGLKVSKNFGLQPYQTTSPLETFRGSVLLPSSVDLLINGIKQSSTPVQPGQFAIQTVPTLTGSGTAELLITDLNGQQRTLSFSLFGSSKLLKAGLSDWSMNLGVSKLNYANQSFRYDHDPLFNGFYRYGLSPDTTLEVHSEFSPTLQMGGLGIVQRLPWQLGIFNGSASYSKQQSTTGQLYNLGYEWSNRWLNFSLQHQQTQGDYKDIGSTAGYDYNKASNQVFFGINTDYGQLGSSYTAQKNNYSNTEFLMLSWSKVLGAQRYLSLSMTRDLTHKSNTFFASLNIPLDRQTNASVYAQHDDEQKITANIRRTANQNQPDWGWQINANNHQEVQAQVQRFNRFGEWEAGIQRDRNQTTSMLAGHGSVLMMNQNLFATRQSLGSFALVSTDGVADIPVSYENRPVGKSNKKGLLLIDYLNPYQHNAISVDALGLPLDYKIETTKIDAVPFQRSGIFIKFPMYRIKSIQFSAVSKDQTVLETGSSVWITPPKDQEKEVTIVGRDGMVYLENPTTSVIYIQNKENICKVNLPDIKNQYGFIDLGIQICQ